MGEKIKIISNGSQAPYGIGEIMDVVPAAHWRKIQGIVGYYYNSPNMRRVSDNRSMRFEISYNEYNKGTVIGLELDPDMF